MEINMVTRRWMLSQLGNIFFPAFSHMFALLQMRHAQMFTLALIVVYNRRELLCSCTILQDKSFSCSFFGKSIQLCSKSLPML